MSAEVIPFAEAAARVRDRRARPALDVVDCLGLAAVCILPLWLLLIGGLAFVEAVEDAWRGKA